MTNMNMNLKRGGQKNIEESVWERWTSVGNEQITCPVPGCGHTGDVLTKAHFRIVHNMTRDEAGELYGYPKRNIMNSHFRKKVYQRAQREASEVITYSANELIRNKGVGDNRVI